MASFFINESTRIKSKKSFRNAFFTTFKEFCEISSIHGIRYFHDTETKYIGNLIWAIVVIAMLFCANAMVYIFYQDFTSNPIRMNIESDHAPLTNLVFPAVTICPPTLYNYPKVKKIFQNLILPLNVSLDEAIINLNQLYAVVGKVRTYDEQKLRSLQKTIEINNMTTLDFLKVIRWNCSDIMYRCRFQSKIVNCSEIFSSSKTYAGYCCSFNINEFGMHFLKYPALKFGPDGGLSVILKNTKADQADLEQFISSEHEVIVHQNDDFPHRTMVSNSIPMNREIFAVIRPTEIVCSDSFKALAVQDRQCLLPHEHNMRFFKVYNSDNCEFECKAISTFDACGCIPFFYVSGSEATACDFTKLPCLYKTYNYFESTANKNNTIDTASECFCPNSCQNIEYDVKITHAQLQTLIDSFDPFYHGVQENDSVLHLFMNSQVYRQLRRDTLSDIIILIGNLGSSFSLFVGMSMISLLEIAYFFSLVLWKNYTKQTHIDESEPGTNL